MSQFHVIKGVRLVADDDLHIFVQQLTSVGTWKIVSAHQHAVYASFLEETATAYTPEEISAMNAALDYEDEKESK